MGRLLLAAIASLAMSPLLAAEPAKIQSQTQPQSQTQSQTQSQGQSQSQTQSQTHTQSDHTIHELQIITAKPGKLAALQEWFKQHDQDVLAKHGATTLAYLVPVGENPDRKILCLYEYPSTKALVQFSRNVKADPLWKPLDTSQAGPDVLVEKTDVMTLRATDFSPEFKPAQASQPRVFELRTYTCPSPEKLTALHSRFRDHTMGLFAKYGMENLVYWQPLAIPDANRKLIYLLGHASTAAAKESFGKFRADPNWLKAKAASEERAGGSLTEAKDGVLSEFFTATEYSPLR